jgi:hypothetical protein
MTDHIHRTVSLGRKTFAFGLPWFTTDEEEQPRKSAAALVKKSSIPYDLCLVRKGEQQQFALACTSDGAKSGSISAAAIVADMSGTDSWLFVMELGDAVWICAGRDGYVLPDGDRVLENHEDAKAAVKNLSPASFKKVSLPRSWREGRDSGLGDAVEQAEITDVRDLAGFDLPKWGKLQALNSTGVLLRAGAALALLGAAGFGVMTFMSGPAPMPIETDYNAVLEQIEAEERRQRQQEHARLDGNQPWAIQPPASAQARACISAIQSMPITPVGYEVTDITCSHGFVEAAVKRGSGYSSWLREWAEGYPGISASTDPTGASGTLSKELPEVPPRGKMELVSSQTFEAIQDEMFERGQIEGAGITVGQPTVQTYPDYPDYVPSFATGTFQITTKRPEVWMDFLKAWDGVTVDQISLKLSDQTYSMEGKLYVPNF